MFRKIPLAEDANQISYGGQGKRTGKQNLTFLDSATFMDTFRLQNMENKQNTALWNIVL